MSESLGYFPQYSWDEILNIVYGVKKQEVPKNTLRFLSKNVSKSSRDSKRGCTNSSKGNGQGEKIEKAQLKAADWALGGNPSILPTPEKHFKDRC